MKIKCLHGYYYFYDTTASDVSDFISYYGLPLVADKDYFTFELLKDAPSYIIKGNTYLGATAIKTVEGKPEDIFRANQLTYNFLTGKVEPIKSIKRSVQVFNAGKFYYASGLILLGSLNDEGLRVTDYSAYYYKNTKTFKYNEVSFV